MIPSFNLVDEPWIPCVMPDGHTIPKSIRDTLLHAQHIAEVCDDSPLVTVALHRLLLAILYRAWDLRSEPDWADLWRDLWLQGQFPGDVIGSYLDRWHDRFDLFSESHPFYQVPRLVTAGSTSPERLVMESQNGHFYKTPMGGLNLEPPDAARLILALHGYAIGLGKSSDAVVDGNPQPRPYSAHGILLSGVTLWFSGENLFQTLMLNFVPLDRSVNDIPAWEYKATNYPFDVFDGSNRQCEPSHGYVDRLTWLSRMVRLLPDSTRLVRTVYFTQGRSEMGGGEPDPMKSYRRSDQTGETPIGIRENRASWRDYYSLLGTADDSFRRASAFNWIEYLHTIGALGMPATVLHVVGLATPEGKAAKLLLWRHDRMPLPAAILTDEEVETLLNLLLLEAEALGSGLLSVRRAQHKVTGLAGRFGSVCKDFTQMASSTADGATDRDLDLKRAADIAEHLDPRRSYWARLEGHFYRLVGDLAVDKEAAAKEWRSSIEREAEIAYREACAGLGKSGLAIQAISRYPTKFRAPGTPNPPIDAAHDDTREEVAV